MKLHFKRIKQARFSRLDITPLIDVVFLLLIFFMLTSNSVLQSGIRVTLPSTGESFTVPSNRVEVYITAKDKVYFRGKSLTRDELLTSLTSAGERFTAVLIFADVDARHGKVVEIEDICRRAGFTSISVATQPVEEPLK
jgi:biopolymer transport protein ExbD